MESESNPFTKPSITKEMPSTFEIQNPSSKHQKPLRQTYLRWIALLLINILALGDFMVIEGPQPIETQLKKILRVSEEQYSMLYTSWAIPSIISPLFGGYLIDKFGGRVTLMGFSIVVTLGQFIYAYGGYILSFGWMIVGRTVYALGTDPLNVVQMVVINKWFNGKELALAISLTGSTFGLGRALNSFLTPILFEINGKLVTPMLFGAVLCLIGCLLSIIVIKWDAENERIEKMNHPGIDSRYQETEKVSLSDMKYFSRLVWLLIFNFGLIYGVSFSFNAFANDLYHIRYQFTNVQAGSLISSNFVVMALSAAACGRIIDKYGRRISLQLCGSLCGLFAFLYLYLNPTGVQNSMMIIPQILFGLQLGVGEAVACPGLPLVLKSKYLGTGYGLFYVVENILVLILPYVGAFIKERTTTNDNDGFNGMILFFMVWSCLIIVAAIKLALEDRRQGKVLELTVGKKTALKQSMIEDLDETAIYSQPGDVNDI